MRLILFLCLSLLVYSPLLNAQGRGNPELTSKSKKAVKHYEKAGWYFSSKNFPEAKAELRDALDSDPGFIEAWLLLGDIESDMNHKEEAITAYLKAISIDEKFFVNTLFTVANLEMKTGKYKDARLHYHRYGELARLNPERQQILARYIDNCDFAIHAIENPVPFEPENLGDSVNSIYNDFVNSITADDQWLYLTIQHPQDSLNSASLIVEDFYRCSRLSNDSWSPTRKLGPPVNTDENEGALCISPDGMHLFFAGCNRSDGMGSCDLYHASRMGQSWTVPENLGTTVNSQQWDSQPSLAGDGRTLYFSSKRSGGAGSSDIWKVSFDDKGIWGKPENLGKVINTVQSELCPFIHPDGKTLYFSSAGHPGMGGYDLFMSRMDEQGNWSEPVNLGYPINTFADEINLVVNAKGDLAYLSSDKEGGVGKKDIYAFLLHEAIRPISVSYFKGKVYDEKSRKPLNAHFELTDLATGKVALSSNADLISGEFLITLPPNRDFALNVNHKEYLFYSENFSFLGIHSIEKPFLKDIPLKKINVGEAVVLRNIFFQTGEAVLLQKSTAELNSVITLLTNNPRLKISIQGHTDNVGTADYNQALSENRAKVVYEYLIANGITATRLSYIGFGKTKAVADNNTEEGRSQNRRTEFVVVEN